MLYQWIAITAKKKWMSDFIQMHIYNQVEKEVYLSGEYKV